MLIGSLPVGRDFPIRVVAEIDDAPLLSDTQIAERARYYISSGADIIDIGMIVGAGREEDARRAVRAAKGVVNAPVSIDTIDPLEARAGVEAGVDLVLSVDGGNVEAMAEFATEVAVVVIPTNHATGYFPKDPDERVETIKRNLRTANDLGFHRILADLILDPIGSPGFVKSIVGFYKFRIDEPELPLFCGVANVLELLDADTPGVNALTAGAATELGINLLLATEVSDKCRGCVKELSIASNMMYLARKRGSIPKDLGIDLLILKDKMFLEEPYNPIYVEGTKLVRTFAKEESRTDLKGCFKIMIDRKLGKVVMIHYPMRQRSPDYVIRGNDAQEIYHAVAKSNLVSDLTHSAYLGYELGKAEIALRTGKGYVQDLDLFT
jgi:dihydropteroate synthase-like protein